jgi:hypothetical protein
MNRVLPNTPHSGLKVEVICWSETLVYNQNAAGCHGPENYSLRACICKSIYVACRDATRITTAEMKYMRTAGYTWTENKTNTEISKELNITPVLDKIQDCRINWIQYVNRLSRNRLPILIKKLQPKRQKEPRETI